RALVLRRADAGDGGDRGEFRSARSLGAGGTPMNASAASLGLLSCPTCSLVSRAPAADSALCPRCGSALAYRKPGSIGRTWAFLIAAMALYVPANTLPIMATSSLFGSQDDTIISGVVFLWEDGSWYLAVIVFVASILVPLAKIIGLGVLLLSVELGVDWRG